MASYQLNDTPKITCTFTVDGTNTDPTTVTLEVKDPAGTKTTYTYAAGQITKSAAGLYYKYITLNLAGTWWYRWTGTGTVADVDVDYLFVAENVF